MEEVTFSTEGMATLAEILSPVLTGVAGRLDISSSSIVRMNAFLQEIYYYRKECEEPHVGKIKNGLLLQQYVYANSLIERQGEEEEEVVGRVVGDFCTLDFSRKIFLHWRLYTLFK